MDFQRICTGAQKNKPYDSPHATSSFQALGAAANFNGNYCFLLFLNCFYNLRQMHFWNDFMEGWKHFLQDWKNFLEAVFRIGYNTSITLM